MTDVAPIEVSWESISPLVFGQSHGESTESPTIMFVVGQPGAGKSAALDSFVDREKRPAVIDAEALAVFHPEFYPSRRWRPFEAQSELAPLVRRWMSDALDEARATRRSVIVEGSFSNPSAVFGTADGFREAGFVSHVVVVGSRRADSLLTTASRFLELRRRGLPAGFTDRDTHARGWVGTQALVRDAEATTPVDRLTVVGRDRRTLFTATREDGYVGAINALDSIESAPMSTLEAAEWFGELRRVTEYTRDGREQAPPVVDVLIELHELALTDVLPRLDVRRGSSFFVEQEARLGGELAELRREASAFLAAPAPVVEPQAAEASRGLSR